jgi:hypothetical protein
LTRPRRGDPPLPIATGRHAVHRLAPDLLLVFKPAGHREEPHAHPHRQTLRVLRGALLVRTARRDLVLRPRLGTLTIVAGRRHATEALADTWLVAESAPAKTTPAGNMTLAGGKRGAGSPRAATHGLPSRRARS